jgi:DNA polymerase-3 subunit epsilon
LFAIVDIETTGGSAGNGGITEIAILLHNGQEVTDRYATLINPEMHIPNYITALTGISNQTVAGAPTFNEIAAQLFDLLKDRIFVAHNVNFDHSFLHHRFKQADIQFQPKKLCTVRYARKVISGLPSYSLGNLCRSLGITIENRHRAAGDAVATAQLFELLLQKDADGQVLKEMTRGRNPHSYLPMNVPVEMIEQLPYCAGVYYFKDRVGKVVYVGKAVNLKYRVKSHFTNNAAGKRRQEMLRNIFSIEYKVCPTELMAVILESVEIKRLWPLYNRSQKKFEPVYGLYQIEDRAGRIRLLIDRKRKLLPPLHTFSQPHEGYDLIKKMAPSFGLSAEWILGQSKVENDLPDDFNAKVMQLIAALKGYFPDFAIVEQGEDEKGNEQYVVYQVIKGAFKGMGCGVKKPADWDQVNALVNPYPENEFIRNALYTAALRETGFVISP